VEGTKCNEQFFVVWKGKNICDTKCTFLKNETVDVRVYWRWW